MMAIAIMCSGGDAPGMNPAIKKFVDYVYEKGEKPYFIYDGLEGLIDGSLKEASYKDVAGIIHLGGTIIRTSRSKRFFQRSFREQAYENLKKERIDSLVVLGGDGSFRAMELFYREFGINFVGIPTTIDNDIYGTNYCLGVDTALNVIRDAIDKIKDTASAFNRAFVVETMGRECGYLAAVSALTSGAEICLIPEKKFEKSSAKKKLTNEIANGRKYLLAVVAEGCEASRELKEWIERTFGFETRISVLGHIQRGGNPTVYDRMMAASFVTKAVDALLSNERIGKAIGYKEGSFEFVDIAEVAANKYQIPNDILNALEHLD